ncbi:cell division topological specificity factor MinE [Rhodovarius crocodyli]|uniref:Cell division topological specificity factor n=1 Tax=Rhodovarius crocodyli TaxID=1979269 RepID=A0A437MHG5_9PROT|nr:cell division topological specificity factor MinE [Rhodovarius crocodyli]RVT97090.1 cell division topological specificity factor MinE [Rhodovarius crocodyli]
MSWLNFFRSQKPEAPSASAAKDRLQIILAHERVSRDGDDFLPKLQKELLEVVARYVKIDADKVKVDLERGQGMSTLAIGVELPGNGTAKRSAA